MLINAVNGNGPCGSQFCALQEVAEAREKAAAARAEEHAAEPGEIRSPGQRVKIVVDGREEFLPLDEVIRRAQVNTAADKRLDEAKRVLAEAKAQRAQPAQQFEDEVEPQPRRHPSSDQREKLRDIVERIQIGDADEGAQALEELMSSGNVERRVLQRMAQAEVEGEMLRAVDRFSAKHPHITSDPDLSQTGISVLARTMREDIKKLGITDEQLAPIRDDVRMLAHTTEMLRRAGHRSVRSFDQVLDATAKTMEQKFGGGGRKFVGTQSDIEARLDRKRAMGGHPRSSGVRMQSEPQPRPKTAQEIVAEIRRARGFPTS
jgi:hypothetical protein